MEDLQHKEQTFEIAQAWQQSENFWAYIIVTGDVSITFSVFRSSP